MIINKIVVRSIMSSIKRVVYYISVIYGDSVKIETVWTRIAFCILMKKVRKIFLV